MSVLIPFPFAPDWSEPFRERPAYLNHVSESHEGAVEQRIALRSLPRSTFQFRLLPLSPRETAALGALLYGAGASLLAVPFWPDRVSLTADVAATDTLLPVTTTALRSFTAGGRALLWRDPHTCELVTIDSIGPTSVVTADPVAADWPGDGLTWVVPAFPGRLEDPSARRIHCFAEELQARFQIEVTE